MKETTGKLLLFGDNAYGAETYLYTQTNNTSRKADNSILDEKKGALFRRKLILRKDCFSFLI